jgi:uncharacterized protein RhaS with RHS repeats
MKPRVFHGAARCFLLVVISWVLISLTPSSGYAGWSYRYTNDDRIKTVVDPSGKSTTVNYTTRNQGRLSGVEIVYPDGSKSAWKYDESGRLQKMSDPAGYTLYGYDDYGRLDNVSRTGFGDASYEFDTLNRLHSLRFEQQWLRFDYSYLNQIENIATPFGDITFQYFPGDGIILRKLPNGIQSQWVFQPDGLLESLTHVDKSSQVISKYAYEYRFNGQLASIDEWSPYGEHKTTFEYDQLDRMRGIKVDQGGWTKFEYDQLGNRTSLVKPGGERLDTSRDWAGRLNQLNGASVNHDAAGNVITRIQDAAASTYEYDSRNLLSKVNATGNRLDYQFDGNGGIVSRSAAGQRTRFFPDPLSLDGRPLAIRRPTGLEEMYVWVGTTPIAKMTKNKIEYYLEDLAGSIRSVFDGNGKLVQQIDYDPFGMPTVKSPDAAGGLSVVRSGDLMPGSIGNMYDHQSGIYLMGGLAYNPTWATVLQQHTFLRCRYNTPMLPITGSAQQFVALGDMSQSMHSANVDNVMSLVGELSNPTVSNLIGAYGLLASAIDLYKYGSAHPGDPAGIAKAGAFGFSALGSASAGTLLGTALGGVAMHISMGVMVGSYVRSHVIQNRAMGLVRLPLGVDSRMKPEIKGGMGFHQGHFSMSEPNGDFEARGGWTLSHKPSSKSIAWANYSFDHKVAADGTLMSGKFRAAEIREVRGGGYRKWRYENVKTTERFDGSVLNAAYAEYEKTGVYDPEKHYEKKYGKEIKYPIQNQESWEAEEPEPPERRRRRDEYLDSVKHGPLCPPFCPPGGDGGGNGGPPGCPPVCPCPPYCDDGGGGAAAIITPDPLDNNPLDRTPGSRVAGDIIRNPLLPSNVGGVYLSGAGAYLDDLGELAGVAVDPQTNQLTLISRKLGKIDLPPLRLDDIVTIFRSVYFHGVAPSVSIDPDRKNPEGPRLLIVHGPGTDNTYVGWVLFECDRVMKSYSLGSDNVTKQSVVSDVPGYKSILEARSSIGDGFNKNKFWERFWIVPAASEQSLVNKGQAVFINVPLKVNTQKMVLINGVLEPAPDDRASAEAQEFARWFTDQYSSISDETRSQKPGANGGQDGIAVFAELQRIAVISALAERLRDQGVPFPAWMNDYRVTPFPMDDSTPSITVEKAGEGWTRSIYGGVNLSPEDDVLIEKPANREMNSIVSLIASDGTRIQPLQSKTIPVGKKQFVATSLPGSSTREVGALFLSSNDVNIPIGEGRSLRITRYYHSFFQPRGLIGPVWTLDFPRLETQRHPIKRVGDKQEFRIGYLLTSPIGSVHAQFRDIRSVEGISGQLMVTDDHPGIIGLANEQLDVLDHPTAVVLFASGMKWHFDDFGNLSAKIDGPAMNVYRRDSNGRITRVEGWFRNRRTVWVDFKYNSAGRLSLVTGSDGSKASYKFNSNGQLSAVDNQSGQIGYHYKDDQLERISKNGQLARQFEFDDFGRVVREKDPGGNWYDYIVEEGQKGFRVSRRSSAPGAANETISYDSKLRPLQQVTDDGRIVSWKYEAGGDRRVTTLFPNGQKEVRSISADGTQVRVDRDQEGPLDYQYDSSGRIQSVLAGKAKIESYEWSPGGQVNLAVFENIAFRPEYSTDGALKRVMLTENTSGNQFDRWSQVELDGEGRPQKLSDCWGQDLRIGYDRFGDLASVQDRRASATVARNDDGRIESIKTSWGYQQDNKYRSDGKLNSITSTLGNSRSTVAFKDGRPTQVSRFDGGKISFDYYGNGAGTGQVRKVTLPNGSSIEVAYTKDGLIDHISIGASYRLKYTYDERNRVTGHELKQ